MKILIVSYSFPPENVIGAVRVGKLAKFLHDRGYDVRVLTVPACRDSGLPLEIPPERVVRAEDRMRDRIFDPLVAFFGLSSGAREAEAGRGASSGVGAPQSARRREGRLRQFLKRHYYAILRIPDARAGWRANAVAAGRELLMRWRPDLIFASSPPVVGLFVAASLSRRFGIPWIADLRDLWTDNPYYEFPWWRRVIDRLLERGVLSQAAALVTVSPLWGGTLESCYHKEVSVVLNGYEQGEENGAAVACAQKPRDVLCVLYTGNIYRGFRDPSPLFAAIGLLTAEERASIRVDFYGPSVVEIEELIERFGVADCVRIHAPVAYHESLWLQREADVLLLLQWNDVRDAGNIPAKFFEYIAASRPILLIGYEQGTLANMIRERNAGLVSNMPSAIAARLSAWIAMRRCGRIQGLDAAVKAGLSRREQFEKLESLLTATVPGAMRR